MFDVTDRLYTSILDATITRDVSFHFDCFTDLEVTERRALVRFLKPLIMRLLSRHVYYISAFVRGAVLFFTESDPVLWGLRKRGKTI